VLPAPGQGASRPFFTVFKDVFKGFKCLKAFAQKNGLQMYEIIIEFQSPCQPNSLFVSAK
jgi:hypothetical protein